MEFVLEGIFNNGVCVEKNVLIVRVEKESLIMEFLLRRNL